jgi:glucose/arabinose dehydrogenase
VSGRLSRVLGTVALGSLVSACGGAGAATERSRTVSERAAFGAARTIVRGLDVPWAIAFAGRRTILVTERPGRIRLIQSGRLRPRPVARLRVVAEGEAGLLGLALDPPFPKRRFAYVYYTARDGNRVSRFQVARDFRFGGERVLLRRIPAAAIHDGGRLAFGPDRMLYVTTGETGISQLGADRRASTGTLAAGCTRPSTGRPARAGCVGTTRSTASGAAGSTGGHTGPGGRSSA